MAKKVYTELTTLHRKMYGRMQTEPNPSLCCAAIMTKDGWTFTQCSKSRGHGPEEAYCAIHDPIRRAKKREAQSAKWQAEHAAAKAKSDRSAAIDRAKTAALEACKAIVAGHNNPAEIARAAIDMLPEE